MKQLLKAIPIVIILFFLSSFSVGAQAEREGLQTNIDAAGETEEIDKEGEADGKEGESKEQQEGFQTKISLDLRSMDIVDTIRFLAKQADVNIVTTDSVAGRITFTLKDVTVGDLLDMIIITNNLARKQKGNILTIMTESEYERLYGERYTSMKSAATLNLEYINTQRAMNLLEGVKSTIGRVVADEKTGTLVLLDTPSRIKQMKKAIEKIDIPTIERILPTVTKEFELAYAKAGEIRSEVEAVLTEGIGRMRVDERTNKLLITDLAHNMEYIEKLIDAFDAETREVRIEAKIIEVALSDEYAFGIEWEKIFARIGSLKNVKISGGDPLSQIISSSLIDTDAGGAAVATLETPHQYKATLEFMKGVGETRILSSPQMTVLHNQEAKFMVGSREAFLTVKETLGDTRDTVSEEVEFVDVGVTLAVTPEINRKGFVKMNIRPEVSSVSRTIETKAGSRIPIVETANLETSVLVKDGHTIVIAGFIREEESKDREKIPFFGDIPLVGNIFRSASDGYAKRELVIFLTPHITSGKDDFSYLLSGQKPRKPPRGE